MPKSMHFRFLLFVDLCITDAVNQHGQLTLHECNSARLTSWNNNQSLRNGKMDWEASTEKIYSVHNATALAIDNNVDEQ